MNFQTIIKEQREELETIEKKEKIISRELIDKAASYLAYPNILAVLGIRRCGKSIFSYLLAKGHSFGYINFDDERLAGIKTEDLNKILQAFYGLYGDPEYIILDELQNIYKWELFANRLRRTKKVIITGSNSKMLSGELSAHLTGRYIDLILSPFSFREFLSLYNIKQAEVYTTKERAEILNCLEQYFKIGGFPEVHKFGKEILARIYNDIVTKDILLRHQIKKIEEIKNMAHYLITNFAQEFSYRKLSNIFHVRNVSTLSKWIAFLENSFLIFHLERFSFKLKQQFIAPKKIYCQDNGLINAVAFNFLENIGRLMENSIAIELLRKKSIDSMLEVYYWKDYQQREVDFVIKKKQKVVSLIQVTNVNSKEEVAEREIKALLRASLELKCDNLLIITYDFEAEEQIAGKTIKFIPLWQWFLQNRLNLF